MEKTPLPNPLIRKVDCVRIYVPSLEEGLRFYRDRLGHALLWRTEHAVGLRMPDTDTELVLQDEDQVYEVDYTVDSVGEATERWIEAEGQVMVPPFDIAIGRAVVLKDPWGNPFVLLDTSKGLFATDEEGNVTGNLEP